MNLVYNRIVFRENMDVQNTKSINKLVISSQVKQFKELQSEEVHRIQRSATNSWQRSAKNMIQRRQ